MGLEAATFIHQLNAAWPTGPADPKSQGDDHLRLLKSSIQATFPNIAGAVTATHTALNTMALGTANPTASIGLAAVNGAATSVMRSDAAPALSQAIAPTWTGSHKFAHALTEIENAAWQLVLDETDAAANERTYLWLATAGALCLATATDAAPTAVAAKVLEADRTGTTVDRFTVFPTAFEIENAAALLQFDETDAPANERNTLFRAVAGDFLVSSASDAAPTTAVNNVLALTRTGTTWDAATLAATTIALNGRTLIDSTTQAQSLQINSNHASGPFASFATASSIFADFGTELNVFGAGATDALAFVTRAAKGAMYFGTVGSKRLVLETTGQVHMPSIHNNGSGATGTNNYIASGTYTPTITAVANVDSTSSPAGHWIRVGREVHVSVTVTVDATATGTSTTVGVSLPIASNLAATSELSGGGAAASTGITPLAISGDTANDRANVQFVSSSVNNHVCTMTFTYTVN